MRTTPNRDVVASSTAIPEGGAATPVPSATASSSNPQTEETLTLQQRTPARILVGRAGPAYRTKTMLELREDHAAARDAVHRELVLAEDFDLSFLDRWRFLELETLAATKREFLLRPEFGRRLSPRSSELLCQEGVKAADLQVCVGDGLSALAVRTQLPELLPALERGCLDRKWSMGRLLLIHNCRVGIMNHVGDLLRPRVVVLLIGERPGLRTAESLSAYMAYRPRPGDTDAQRNLVSNIHGHGIESDWAAERILALAGRMVEMECSGVSVKESLGAPPRPAAIEGDAASPSQTTS